MYGYYSHYNVTQSTVKALYEKTYGERYNTYTTPFYLEGIQPENIEQYITSHHNQ